MTNQTDNKFDRNWDKNKALFGQEIWEQEADFCYFIETPLPLETAQKLFEAGQKIKTDLSLDSGQWLSTKNLHLTITLPGRLGTHFQKNDIAFMKKTLAAVTAQTPSFELIINNFNVFPNTLWAEVTLPGGYNNCTKRCVMKFLSRNTQNLDTRIIYPIFHWLTACKQALH